MAALLTAARAVADAEGIAGEDRGYRLVFNVGPDALNSVPHLHLHVLGGRRSTGRRAEAARHPARPAQRISRGLRDPRIARTIGCPGSDRW